MQIKQTLLRAAAAATAAAVMALGAGASAQAAMVSSDASGKGATQSAEAKENGEAGKQNAEGNQAAAADKREAGSPGESEAGSDSATGPDHSQGNASTQGEYDEPQPESNADWNDGGANAGTCGADTGGPYCSTRDGSASDNGKGDGKATGRPAAGTVGKADNKNPRGQLPGPDSDGNNGYECDGNQGIAKGNPAHTACTETGVSDSQDGGTTTSSSSNPSVGGSVALSAEETPEEALESGRSSVEVLGVEGERAAVPTVLDAQATASRAPAVVAPVAGVLPATGAGDYVTLLAGGGALLAAGGAVLARRRADSAG